MVTTWPRDFPGLGTGAQRVAKRISDMTNGRMVVQYFAGGERVKPFDSFDEVASGNAQMYHAADYYWKGKHPGWGYFTAVPFGLTYTEFNAWVHWGGGQQLWDELAAEFGLKCIACGNTGVQMGGWFRKEINTLDDLNGLKMRIPGFAGEVLSKLGVVVTNIAPGELYTALERGTIDALEWVGPSLDLNMGFQKIAPYYYTGWHEPATELQFMVNKAAFDSLPAHLQAILVTAMQYAAYDMYAMSYHDSAVNWASIEEEYPDVKIRTFPPEIIAEMKRVNQELLVESAAADPMFKEIFESQAAYMKMARKWTEISDYAYLKDNLE